MLSYVGTEVKTGNTIITLYKTKINIIFGFLYYDSKNDIRLANLIIKIHLSMIIFNEIIDCCINRKDNEKIKIYWIFSKSSSNYRYINVPKLFIKNQN